MNKRAIGTAMIVVGLLVLATGIYEYSRGNDGLGGAAAGALLVSGGFLLRRKGVVE